ncbi:hypothetical protein RFI_20922 [Reticulomyxa filosa]|uniref:Dienelactone hydrolase domain-containing protein n=1 Tax=Reticulomyxa filosa TaxID=46433 RepID=X6MSL1_RETFI|nr:hypothetical protein RFI_20922 [Reticulomyxa filosa]|eukprot:ETO16417.1 hypothetical protein RFI_20922 [Reticulomyxa filosa]
MATAACNEAGPGKTTDYEPKGKTTKVSDLPIYVTGKGASAIILFYDILGWGANKLNNFGKKMIFFLYMVIKYVVINRNLFELSDRFAEAGHTVIMCDHFRGNPWPSHRLPFKDDKEQQEFFQWFGKNASPELFVKDMKEIAIPYLEKEQKCTHITSIGFCMGGLMVCVTRQTNLKKKGAFHIADDPKIAGIASIHGARITEELVSKVKCPVYYGATPKDTPVETVKKILDEKDFAKKCVYHTFEKMEHGFCGSRGDWKNAEVKKNVDLVVEQMLAFSKQTIKA